MARQLTEQQQKFLSVLFEDAGGDEGLEEVDEDRQYGAEVMVEMQAGMLVTVKSNAELLKTQRRSNKLKNVVHKNKTYFHHPDLHKPTEQLLREALERKNNMA